MVKLVSCVMVWSYSKSRDQASVTLLPMGNRFCNRMPGAPRARKQQRTDKKAGQAFTAYPAKRQVTRLGRYEGYRIT